MLYKNGINKKKHLNNGKETFVKYLVDFFRHSVFFQHSKRIARERKEKKVEGVASVPSFIHFSL